MTKYRFVSLEVIHQLDEWDRAEETATGTREKAILVRPDDGKYFLFKYPKQHREHQIWSEMIASFIAGDLLGWDVQHVSIGSLDGRPGNLLEFIYEPGNRKVAQETFIEGWSFCTQVDPQFDVGKGTRHTLPLIIDVHTQALQPTYGISRDDYMEFWAKAFALDALISNIDRHAENWAICVSGNNARMAPLYDNGSSMGCGLDQGKLERCFDNNGRILEGHLNSFSKKGRHHVRLETPNKRGTHFEEVCTGFLAQHPEGRTAFEAALSVDLERVMEFMTDIQASAALPEPFDLSNRRKNHIYAILQIGVERIRNVLR